MGEQERACLLQVQQDACHKGTATEGMHQQVAKTRFSGFPCPSGPDKEQRGYGHDFPEENEGEQVTGEDHSQRTPHIEHCRHLLQRLFHMVAVYAAEEAHNDEDVTKSQAQPVYAADH